MWLAPMPPVHGPMRAAQRTRSHSKSRISFTPFSQLSAARDAIGAQIRAAEQRTVETRNAIDTGVALEMKAAEVRVQIAQAQHARGQLQDAVADMKLELADMAGLPLDTELALAAPAGPEPDSAPEARLRGEGGSRS